MAETFTTARKRFRIGDQEAFYILSEGNPGALSVIIAAAKQIEPPDDLMFLLNLDDMNIRGEQIWVGYSGVCKRDLKVFVERVGNRDPDLVAAINSIIPDGERAVVHGASFAHG